MNLERILQSQGFGSRSQCKEMILAGRVRIDGAPSLDPERNLATEALRFTVDAEEWEYREKIYLILNKPRHYECSHRPSFHPSVFFLLPITFLRRGVQCVGRLDEDTTGLLLFSDDGAFIHRMTSPRKKIRKIYEVGLRHVADPGLLQRLLGGVRLKDDPVPVCAASCELLSERLLRLSITEGKYHQVKRMIAAAGNRVETLRRVAIGRIELPDDLLPGQWIWMDAEACFT